MHSAVLLGNTSALDAAYTPALREKLAGLCRLDRRIIAPDEWRSRTDSLGRADVIFSAWGMPKMDAEFLSAAPNLRAVFYAAGSVKDFYTPEAQTRGIVVSTASEANSRPVAEYTLGAILLGLKNFWKYARQSPAEKCNLSAPHPPGACGTKVGLVALGAIGRRVARLLRGHGIDVLVHDPFVTAADLADLGAKPAGLEEIFSSCHVVSLHAPWLPETENMIGAPLLSRLGKDATFINTSRGALVNEAGLAEVMSARPDLTAILDVTHPTPPAPDSALRSLPNVILTPHIAGSVNGEIARMGEMMTEEFSRYADNQPLRFVIDPNKLKLMA